MDVDYVEKGDNENIEIAGKANSKADTKTNPKHEESKVEHIAGKGKDDPVVEDGHWPLARARARARARAIGQGENQKENLSGAAEEKDVNVVPNILSRFSV